MLSVIYCTRNPNPEFAEHLKKTSGIGKYIEIIEIVNTGESLTTCYNKGLHQAKNDVCVFCHDDLIFSEEITWGNRIIKHFEKSDYGIIGLAGTKLLNTTGKWFDEPNKLYGRVSHTHEGKTVLSAFSPDIGNNIEEVVALDGLFFSVHKKRIKKEFDESFTGFHFYDISFSFQNYLEGVKIGVITNVKVLHKSVGIMNQEWENSRLKFVNKYKNNLPAKIKKVFGKGEKIKVLIGCLNFNSYTGSELYVYELAKELVKQNCDVTILSKVGEPLNSLAKKHGIKTCTESMFFKIANTKFDILHLNHTSVTELLLQQYHNTPAVCTIHSEIIEFEKPVISPQIKKYIAVRPEIKKYLIDQFKINENEIEVIYNPIDYNRFKIINTSEKRDRKRTLFVGTIDSLRKKTIQDLINTTRKNNDELWIVGKKNIDDYLSDIITNESHVKYFTPEINTEHLIHKCDVTAGILLGRTTIEGWMCGKDGIIYDVDGNGNIKSKSLHKTPDDVDKFKSDNVARRIIEIYKETLE